MWERITQVWYKRTTCDENKAMKTMTLNDLIENKRVRWGVQLEGWPLRRRPGGGEALA
jgi:hypothetical protein